MRNLNSKSHHKMAVDREECVYMAKLAEQAERYDEMVSIDARQDDRGFVPTAE